MQRLQPEIKALQKKHGGDREKIERGWLLVLGRKPSESQVQDALDYLRTFPASSPRVRAEMAWASYAKALIASNDFLYVH